MFLQKLQTNQRLISSISNAISKNVKQPCQSLQAHKTMSFSASVSGQSLHSHSSTALPLPLPALALGVAHTSCRHYSAADQPYKRMRIKAKDLEKVNCDDHFGGLDPSLTLKGFEESKELQDANEMVKKIFSLQLASQRQISEKHIKILSEKVKLDPDKEENFYASLIVKQTVIIRQLSRRLQTYKNRKDVNSKVRLIHLLDKRRKMLKMLRKENYAQFEKVKEVLGIDWIPAGRYDYFPDTRRVREKRAVIDVAYKKKKEALKVYMAEREEAQLLEIAQLKKELGVQLSVEEQERLIKSEEN